MAKMLSPRFALPALVIVGLLVTLALSWRPDAKLHLHAMNVDGMPVFVQTPSGKCQGPGHIVSVSVGDNRTAREWLDMIAAKRIEVFESGLGIGVEDGIALTLGENGGVQIEAGATSVGIGSPFVNAHADVVVLDEVTDQATAWLKTDLPQIVVTQSPVEAEKLVEGIVFIDAAARSAEMIFDGVQWEVRASP